MVNYIEGRERAYHPSPEPGVSRLHPIGIVKIYVVFKYLGLGVLYTEEQV